MSMPKTMSDGEAERGLEFILNSVGVKTALRLLQRRLKRAAYSEDDVGRGEWQSVHDQRSHFHEDAYMVGQAANVAYDCDLDGVRFNQPTHKGTYHDS